MRRAETIVTRVVITLDGQIEGISSTGVAPRTPSEASWRDSQNTLSPFLPSPSSLPTRGVYAALAGLGSKLLAQLQTLPYLIFSVRDELQF